MKDNVTYNHADNKVMVRTDGDLIYVICNKENQQKKKKTKKLRTLASLAGTMPGP